MMLDELRSWLDQMLAPWAATKGIDPLPAYTLEEPPAGIEADAACNIALLLAKPLRQSPRALAQEIQKILSPLPAWIEGTDIAGAGFVNFRWTLARLQQEVVTIVRDPQRYGRPDKTVGEKVLIEFVSANPTGPLHVGHGRGAALGDSLALILSHLGYAVNREYYINDAGNQVELLARSVQARCWELQGKVVELPAEGYHGDYIREVADEYLKANAGSVDDLAALQSFALSRMQKQIEMDLADFGVTFQTWFSEAGLVQKGLVDKHVERLREKGYVRDADGAVWFVAPGEEETKDKDRVLKRKDGRWTYFATDVAYHADKFERGFGRLIDIWGADHHGYVARVKGSMQALGHDPNALHVILYQLVSLLRGGKPVSMSKRSGDFITLREVLNEVGKDACRFFFAMRGPNTALDFDLELAKKQSADNPVYYLQYAHARICSIFRQAGISSSGVEGIDFALLKEKEERNLMKHLSFFPQVLKTCANEDSPHPLANYLLALCRQFHYFYDHHRVLGDDPALTKSRLALLEAVRQILRLGLSLLGVSAPESM